MNNLTSTKTIGEVSSVTSEQTVPTRSVSDNKNSPAATVTVEDWTTAEDMKLRLWLVRPESIRAVDATGSQEKLPSHIENVRALADSMKVSGYPNDQPMSCRTGKDELSGENILLCYKGRVRLEAVMLAKSEGAAIEMVPVLVDR